MGFFSRSAPAEDPDRSAASTAAWQSVGGDSTTLSQHESNAGDGSGFLHPESSLSSNRELRDNTEWSKERTSQQLELEDGIDREGAGGCCANWMEGTIKALHVVDASAGIAMIVYGALILQFDEPALAAVLFCLILGCVHLATSLLGMWSYFMRGCGRFGLAVSAWIGPYVAFFYLTMVISLAVDSSGFLQYLDDHKEVMYLGPNAAANCRRLLPLFYTILIVLGLLESSRFCVLVRMRDRLLRNEEADAFVPRSSHRSAPVSANNTLTEALLNDAIEAERAEAGGKETAETPDWWEK
ncbi:hypothetical protein ACHAXT_000114 [Thalassiosira profunda]